MKGKGKKAIIFIVLLIASVYAIFAGVGIIKWWPPFPVDCKQGFAKKWGTCSEDCEEGLTQVDGECIKTCFGFERIDYKTCSEDTCDTGKEIVDKKCIYVNKDMTSEGDSGAVFADLYN